MKELIERLKSPSSKMEELNSVLSKKGTDRPSYNLLYKRVEDGIRDHRLKEILK